MKRNLFNAALFVSIIMMNCSEDNPGKSPAKPVSNTGTVLVISPNGDETYVTGDTMVIRGWADTSKFTRAQIYWSSNNGVRWELLNTGLALDLREEGENFSYYFIIPDSLGNITNGKFSVTSDECLIRITDYETSGSEHEDNSDKVFRVAKK